MVLHRRVKTFGTDASGRDEHKYQSSRVTVSESPGGVPRSWKHVKTLMQASVMARECIGTEPIHVSSVIKRSGSVY